MTCINIDNWVTFENPNLIVRKHCRECVLSNKNVNWRISGSKLQFHSIEKLDAPSKAHIFKSSFNALLRSLRLKQHLRKPRKISTVSRHLTSDVSRIRLSSWLELSFQWLYKRAKYHDYYTIYVISMTIIIIKGKRYSMHPKKLKNKN